ncbi:nucleotide exchange factor GrpE [[Mycoplasma] falconis]|uniref:Protein GrpE n=1 Tax=[Mycoplasma] falconis TaxID=92403 RepID=A0A501X890_9BACT|nr:nucleotide exchange factor GrpE [[Mycoplasma] falconis]TPE56760.1 nucleotide exchange factor GrpE [[Mycoplasma] falconis]
MKLNKYDYVEYVIISAEDHKLMASDKEYKPKEEPKSFVYGIDLIEENLEKLLTGKNLKLNMYHHVNIDNKKVYVKVTKHLTTPEPVVNLINENIEITNKLNLKNQELENTILNLRNEMKEHQEAFKIQVEKIQSKAQEELNNFKKDRSEHFEKELKEGKQYALQRFLEDLILPINNFEIAIAAAKNNENQVVQNFAKGFDMLYNQLGNILADAGVVKIQPQVGNLYNPMEEQVYEVVASDLPKDTILEVKNIGYKLHDRTIKPALVIVAK